MCIQEFNLHISLSTPSKNDQSIEKKSQRNEINVTDENLSISEAITEIKPNPRSIGEKSKVLPIINSTNRLLNHLYTSTFRI